VSDGIPKGPAAARARTRGAGTGTGTARLPLGQVPSLRVPVSRGQERRRVLLFGARLAETMALSGLQAEEERQAMKRLWVGFNRYSSFEFLPQRMPGPGALWRSDPRVWRRFSLSDRKQLLAMVAQSEARRLATRGPFPNSFQRLMFLRRALGGCVTVLVHGRMHMARLGRRGLALRGARAGGRATLLLHGRAHFQEIGKRGAAVRWARARDHQGTEEH
jgi:hypothetical protein